MRTDIMKWLTRNMTARDAVMLVLTSDMEVALNYEKKSKGTPRSLASLKDFNPKITYATLARLVKDGLVEQVKFDYRLALRR